MKQQLADYQIRNNQKLESWLDTLEYKEQSLIQAMHYGLLLGGKRARPFLVYAVGEMLDCPLDELDTPACAIECIHAYSLIHDDLPAMDDDDLRRGHATCHIKFDEATAILTGDALQTLAFTILSTGQLTSNGEINRVKMIQELANASGAQGMCLGQALDLLAENTRVSLSELEAIHKHKTGALILCAVRLGALCAGEKGQAILPQLDRYAKAVGLAFQIQDDILDIVGDTETMGKPKGSDIEHNKSTYPSLLGLEGAMEKADELLQEALHALALIPYNTRLLEAFARYVVERKQ